MLLREVLEKYIDDPVIVAGGLEDEEHEVRHALNFGLGDTQLARHVESTTGPDPNGTVCVWLVDHDVECGSGPDFILHDVPLPRRKPGRPKERTGEYETISLEVPSDVLKAVDSGPESRREFYERIARRELGGK